VAETLYADVTCQLSAEEVGGWTPEHMRNRKMSVGVTWNSQQPSHRVYLEQDVEALVAELEQARMVVGYNCLAFDFEILRGYRSFQPKRILDLCSSLRERTGQQIPISSVWKGTFGSELGSDGLDRIELWRAGQLPLLVESCVRHLCHIRQIHEYGLQHGRIAFLDRYGELRKVNVDWTV
jgi:hypothetical protein